MDKYYYTVAQLPMIEFDKDTYLTGDDYLKEVVKWLSITEYKQLSDVNINNSTLNNSDPEVLQAFKKFEIALRSDIADWRKAQKAGYEYKTQIIPQNMLKEGTPLEIEKKLIQLRWKFCEDTGFEHTFDFGFLILFYIKLQLLERLKTFDKEQGVAKFKQFTEVGI